MKGPGKTLFSGVLAKCSNVCILDLSTNCHIKDISFIGHLRNIKELHLECCVNIDEERATHFLTKADACIFLEVLNLRGGNQFNEDQLIALALGLRNLRDYNIEGCGKISVPTAIVILNNSFDKLKRVFLNPDFESYPRGQWEALESMFCELKLRY